ncbi:DNA (cytosine-5)-methyltransferase 1 [Enterococcus sp. DIV1279b]|uniref:DNA cytosine methyltransferase n=1 Tax=Enterococcus TaxID=1350 RepID=UPI00115F5130|nr:MULTISPECIES: DNA cytosine methyltransferase [Enterococcus]MDT2667863.1 DNA cytosine methyltransferase [Enterococcus dongliensis]
MTTHLVDIESGNILNHKSIEQRSRGKFKPETRKLTNIEIKSVLLDKISEEELSIVEDEKDKEILNSLNYKKNKFNVVSLFSGAGGLDLGLELAGLSAAIGEEEAIKNFYTSKKNFDSVRENSIFNTIYTNDMFKEANESYKLNFPSHVIQHEKDIRKVAHFPDCQIMVGGFPCPGFSEAGPRLIDDPRNFLYIHFIRALTQAQPAFFVAENVKGMMTLGKGEVLKQIIEDFASAGYTVTPHLVNARDYGVPQLRERVFLIGVHKEKIENRYGYHYTEPEPSHGDISDINLFNNKKPYVTLKDAIGDLESDPGDFFEGDYSTIYMSRNRKKMWDEQSFTIQASGRQAPQHPSGEMMTKLEKNKWRFNGEINRRLSVKEIARIQTFPDWFQFSDGGSLKLSKNGRLDKIYKQIGNAVPVLLAKAMTQPIADFVYTNILGESNDN